ncbi:MAG: glyoxalase [Actinobacteria bacterium]|nr:glyoxalase [Actinomycetota bacterium]
MARIEELTIADAVATWAALGFAVEGDVCRVGGVPLRLAGRDAGHGLVEWTLSGASSEALDGLPTRLAAGEEHAPADAAPVAHPNGVSALDHVVAIAPALDRTVAALQAAGLDLRRVREQPTPAGAPRQAFFRLGEVILEVVQAPDDALARSGGPDGPAFFWGLAFKTPDLDATVAAIGEERCSPPRAAVQPGRRIATLRRAAGLALPVALMTE